LCPHYTDSKRPLTASFKDVYGFEKIDDVKSYFNIEKARRKGAVVKFCNCFKNVDERKNYETILNNENSVRFLFPEEVEINTILKEGSVKKIVVNAYERNPKAREKCLIHHGYSCKVCEVNFENIYGDIGKEFIHVHHLKEISEIGTEYEIDPINDLQPVCPNCHAMLHQRKPCYSIDELKSMLKK
jgi:predicted HNH restriction endonuclease